MASRNAFSPRRLFRELRWEVIKAIFLNELLNATIVFFALNIVFTFFNMSYIPSAVIAALLLIYRTAKGFHKSVLRRIEEGNPEVHEILRTAYEYQGERTLMAQGLLYDLQKRLATVSTGVLLDPRKVLGKVVVIALFAFVPIIITSFLPFLIQQNPLHDVSFDPSAAVGSVRDFLAPVELNQSEAIYGDAQRLELGDDELYVEVRPGGSSVSFDTVGDAERRSFEYNDYPPDVRAEAAEYGQSGVYAEEDRALIDAYACESRGTC